MLQSIYQLDKGLRHLANYTKIEYRYNSLNDLVVAKMKSNTLDGIDSDLESIEKFYRNQYGENSHLANYTKIE